MKRMLFALAVIAAMIGCKKVEPTPVPTPEPTPEPQDVQLVLTYTLDASSGTDMTKASNADVFDMFYQKMKEGELVAPKYHIVFTETTTGEKYQFDGFWADNDMVTIRTGNYKIEGYAKADGTYIQDKASLKFEEEMSITASMSSITLKAEYDCFLLAFASKDIQNMRLNYRYYGDSNYTRLYKFNDYYYCFCNNVLYSNETNMRDRACITGEKNNGAVFTIYVGYANLEKGKYYIYTDVSGSFELPKMEAGI